MLIMQKYFITNMGCYNDQVREGGEGGRCTRRSPKRQVYMRKSVMAHYDSLQHDVYTFKARHTHGLRARIRLNLCMGRYVLV
jgi:hypothetical protein